METREEILKIMPVLVSGLFRAQTERLTQPIPMCCEQTHLIIWPCVCVCVMGSYCSPVGAGSSCLWLWEWGQSCGWLGWCRSSSFWLTLVWQESRAVRCIFAPLSGFKNRRQDLTQILAQCPTVLQRSYLLQSSEQTLCRVVLDLFVQQVKYWVRKSAGASNVGRCLSQDVSAVFSLTYFN